MVYGMRYVGNIILYIPPTYNSTGDDDNIIIIIIIIISGRRRELRVVGGDTRRPAHPASSDKWHRSYGAVRPPCGDTAATAAAAATLRPHWHTGRRRRIASHRLVAPRTAHTTSPPPPSSPSSSSYIFHVRLHACARVCRYTHIVYILITILNVSWQSDIYNCTHTCRQTDRQTHTQTHTTHAAVHWPNIYVIQVNIEIYRRKLPVYKLQYIRHKINRLLLFRLCEKRTLL